MIDLTTEERDALMSEISYILDRATSDEEAAKALDEGPCFCVGKYICAKHLPHREIQGEEEQ